MDEYNVFNPINTEGTLYDKAFFTQPTTVQMGEVLVAFHGLLTDARVLRHCSLTEAKQSTVIGTSPITLEDATECPALIYGPATVRFDSDVFPVIIAAQQRQKLYIGHRLGIVTHKDTHDARKWGRWAPVSSDPWNGFPDDPWQVSPVPVDEAWGRLAARHHHHRHYVPDLIPPPSTCALVNEYQLMDRIFAFVCDWVLDPRFDIDDAAQITALLRRIRYDPLPAMALRLDLTWRSRRPVTDPPVRRAVREEALVIGMILANKQIDLIRDF